MECAEDDWAHMEDRMAGVEPVRTIVEAEAAR
jgi:hypothetical protein